MSVRFIDKEARAGLPRMRGARVHATVPISQALVDEVLGNAPLKVAIQEQNRLLISYGAFRVAADIVEVTPELTIVLSTSWVSRMAVRGALAWKPSLQSYVAQKDRFVYLSCGQIPAVAKYRHWWRHLSQVQARTSRGRLVLDLDVHVR